MKFGQLPIGTRFEHEGVRYLKRGPLVAAREDGGPQRFLGRYTDVRLLDAAVDQPRPKGSVDWRTAFDAFYAECIAIVDRPGTQDPDAAARAREALEAARRRLLAAVAGEPS